MRGKQEEALADFKAVLELPAEKRLIEAALARGQLYLQHAEVQKALDDFDQVVSENPRLRLVYLFRSQIYIAKGDNVRALKDLDAYLAHDGKIDRRPWEVHGLRGGELRYLYAELPPEKRKATAGKAMLTLAVAELNEAVKLGAQEAEVFNDLGAMLELTGQVDEAILAYSNGLKLAPRDVRLLNKRGWAYDGVNQRDKALADFIAATKVDPLNADAHSGLGYIRAVQNFQPEAQREAGLALLQAPELSAPQNYLLLHNVACIYAVLSQVDTRRQPRTRMRPSQCSAVPFRSGRKKGKARTRSSRSRAIRRSIH